MVSFHIAYTSPINPAGSSPLLTRAQVWAGLQRKIRHADEFVPAIVACHVLSETGPCPNPEVTREVEFKPGMGPPGRVREVCRSFHPSWVDFVQRDGSTVKNVLSDGAPSEEGGESTLWMTYVFEWRHDGVAEGGEQAKVLEEKHRKVGDTNYPAPMGESGPELGDAWPLRVAKMAVDSSIESIRNMVREGKIE
ncbi:hypothetical protein MKZ38_009740 [Zalerion maritima]|uniref:DUF1857-domain-containing protein n=1 Tax=Zalerion maritima TaxID=339359 RepID=A0AAD5RU72_9PEZI|nr:hypothetical protein MKZ38_009740 [Zalerion maritima]